MALPRNEVDLESLQPPDEEGHLTRFTLLSELPLELRIQIWKHAVPRGRILRLGIDHADQYYIHGSFSRVPTILHICHESREIGLQLFRLGFHGLNPKYEGVYWRPDADTVLFVPGVHMSWQNFPGFLHKTLRLVLHTVQHLAFPLSQHLLRSFQERWMLEILQGLDALKTLSLVLDPHHQLHGWISGFRAQPAWSPPSAIALDESFERPIPLLDGLTPSSIEQGVGLSLAKFEILGLPCWQPPSVKFFVVTPRRFKRSGFCVAVQPRDISSREGKNDIGRVAQVLIDRRNIAYFWQQDPQYSVAGLYS